jgi:Tol biopolymer transport system component
MVTPGTRLGPYEIVSALGAGGMGEVYRATDTNLKRQVAIKVLPQAVAADFERVARFQREAELLAALNHPNIAHIHGLEKSDETIALVMELVEGPTLADRIAQGAIALVEALPIAKQIAEALEAAHEQGIIHRDLKPANVKVRLDGMVKVLDFGLAKALDPRSSVNANATHSPTLNMHATYSGVILGTAAYMSPEQARGKTLDKRTDIWSFGCVLYEMLTGRSPFAGETSSDTIAAILEREPDWTALPDATPFAIRRLLQRCLERDPRQRRHDIADVRIEVEEAIAGPDASQFTGSGQVQAVIGPAASRATARSLLWVAALGMPMAVIALAIFAFRRPAADLRPLRLSVIPPPGITFTPKDISGMPDFAVSPDGSRLAFVASAPLARPQLWVHELATAAAQPVAGTADATGPFWAPDSRTLAFYAHGKLKRVSLGGAAPQDLADVTVAVNSGAWSADGIILFSGSVGEGALFRISSEGGPVVPVTRLDAARGELVHSWPQFLPDGRRFIYHAQSRAFENGGVYLGSIDSNERTLILRTAANAVYATSGHLLFEQSGNLMVQAFEARTGVLSGQASALGDRVSSSPAPGYLPVSIGADGTMAYWNGRPSATELLWFERNGRPLGRIGTPGPYQSPALSPDATKVLITEMISPGRTELTNVDVSSGVTTRLMFSGAGQLASAFGIWSSDGKDIVYTSVGANGVRMQQRAASGIGREPELLGPPALFPEDWSRDGRWLVHTVIAGKTLSDIWAFNLADRKSTPIVEQPGNQVQARLSSDGRWLAYTSDESGNWEVYVQSFPDGRGKWLVSTAGGSQPLWRRDGKELFYVAADDRLIAVPIIGTTTFEIGVSRPLFVTRIPPVVAPWRTNYAVSSDGQRFLINSVVPEAVPGAITIAVNWQQR